MVSPISAEGFLAPAAPPTGQARPAAPLDPPSPIMLTHDDLLWYKTSEDEEGRITLGLLTCSPRSIGVLVDDNGASLGLRLSRSEAQELHRTLAAWLGGTAGDAGPVDVPSWG